MKLLLTIAIIISLLGCSKENAQQATSVPPQQPTYNVNFETLHAAIAGSRLDMTDTENAALSKGALQLAVWAAEKLRWADLQKVAPGKYGLAMKDPDTQRGYRLCVAANIIEITAQKTANGQKVFLGGLMNSYSGSVYRFIAVGSTGELVANSYANFCGVFTGRTSYSNSAGGTTHAVQLVGMFNLPENK